MKRKIRRRLSKIYLPTPITRPRIKFPWSFLKKIFCLSFLLGAIYWLFYSSYFKITEIKFSGPAPKEAIELADKAKGENLWLFKKSGLVAKLVLLPEIESAIVKKKPPSTLWVTLKERQPVLAWSQQDRIYLVDYRGRVIKEISEKPPNLPLVLDFRKIEIKPGKQVALPLFVDFIKNLVLKFNPQSGLVLKELIVPEDSFYEVVVQTESFKVIFDSQGDLDQQLENLRRVYQAKKDEIKEYMDLRIEGRVYYK